MMSLRQAVATHEFHLPSKLTLRMILKLCDDLGGLVIHADHLEMQMVYELRHMND